MTLDAYSGRHSTFDATTVLPAWTPGEAPVPPRGAPPGLPALPPRPSTVTAAFCLAMTHAALWIVGSLVALGLAGLMVGATADVASAVGVVAVIGVPITLGVGTWIAAAARMRAGHPGARVLLAVLAGLGALLCAALGLVDDTILLPLVGLALHGALLVLLFRPSTDAWFRAAARDRAAVSPAPGPGSPPR
ncbi:hypothetical protein [Actinomycetospora atypica]|uniref:Uncharacterized protein n=1 Tax=Actinomycetospora atypica TaxID=1290095 RepID=A0ABV9YM48_9PSEU